MGSDYFQFWLLQAIGSCALFKIAKTTLIELSFNNNLVNIEIVLEVLKPAESKFDLYFWLYMFFMEGSVIPWGT